MKTGYDGQWLDSMYNNRMLVPQHPEHFRRWAADSADVDAHPGVRGGRALRRRTQ